MTILKTDEPIEKSIEDQTADDYYDGMTRAWSLADVNRPVVEAWADSLENDGLPQTKGKLRRIEVDDDEDSDIVVGMCCLGVLSEQAVTAGVVGKVVDEENGIVEYGPSHDANMTPLPVVEWAGLPSEDPVVKATVNQDYVGGPVTSWFNVATLNDSYGWSFPEIAKAIRETYLV